LDLAAPTDVDLELRARKDGKITKVSLFKLPPGKKLTVVTNIVHTRAVLAATRIKEPMLQDRTWTERYTAAELAEANMQTHLTEMAPLPPRTNAQPPPGTHMFEMAPDPYRDK
jgi:hypothetical protein